MKNLCPQCGGEYRKGFEKCPKCNVDLVDRAELEDRKKRMASPQAALEGVPTVVALHAGLAACREIERELIAAGIACYVAADADEPETAPGALKVGVVVAQSDLPRVGEVLRQRFAELVAKEGVGQFQSEAVDLSAAEVACPACGHKGALVDGACADCGLFLGAPE